MGPQAACQPATLTSDAHSSTDRKSLEQHAVRTAEKLLRDFYPRSDWGQTQLRLLQSLCLLATRDKANVEAALGTFIAMAQAEVGRLAGWAAGGRAGGAQRADARFPPVCRRTASPPCWPRRRPTRC